MNFQEKKNFEFFFKPRDIETHMGLAIQGNMFGSTSSNQIAEDCYMDIDEEMIPDGDDLISALMT
jgi:hypothetical protein